MLLRGRDLASPTAPVTLIRAARYSCCGARRGLCAGRQGRRIKAGSFDSTCVACLRPRDVAVMVARPDNKGRRHVDRSRIGRTMIPTIVSGDSAERYISDPCSSRAGRADRTRSCKRAVVASGLKASGLEYPRPQFLRWEGGGVCQPSHWEGAQLRECNSQSARARALREEEFKCARVTASLPVDQTDG